MNDAEQAIDIRGLRKVFDDLVALDGIDLGVRAGEFFGLLGPNGAGKTTTINVLSGLANKTAGEVTLFGRDLVREYRHCRRLVGLVPQEFNFDLFSKVEKILIFQGGYFGIPEDECKRRAEKLMEQFDLTEKRQTPARYLSGGMKRRLMIARALIHQPQLLILDEPTAGVDVDLRRSLWKFLRDINASGTTILLTTHYIEEAEALCDTIGIIHHGLIIEVDSTRKLANRLGCETVLVTSEQPIPESATRVLAAYQPTVNGDGHEMQITFHKDQVPYATVLQNLVATGIPITNIRPAGNRLETVFLELTQGGASHG